uniref:Putative muscarinic acetylcholine (GAR) receptor-2 n=1 Tax=Cryptocotyle lingua TaxID=66766 RepID=A0A7U0YEW8_9TREM|nr:putative muscarinic acetylcholine (GAR) receptor-2 [Cryptocotyle lingua]
MNATDIANFPPFAKGIVGLLAGCVSTATLGGNIVVLIAFFVESSLRIPSNYFIASLAVTDVLIGLFSMNLFITYQLLGYWPLGQWVCDIWLSLDFSACLTSQYTVFLITVDRYCSVKIPASYRNWRTLVKVRWMICVSWLFPAGLFTPVIMGWKQITSEPPRAEGKCDVSFTYYPIFNTTLIIGYFWTTLIVMCSLYVGIYQVARRLERKSLGTTQRFAALFQSLGADPTEAEHQREIETEKITQICQPSKSVVLNSMAVNDSGFKEAMDDGSNSNDGSHVVKQNCIALTAKQQHKLTASDNESIYSPLKTTEEPIDLTKVLSPVENTQELSCEYIFPNCSSDVDEDLTVEDTSEGTCGEMTLMPIDHLLGQSHHSNHFPRCTTETVSKIRSESNNITVLEKRINFEYEPFLYRCREPNPKKNEDTHSLTSDMSSSKEPIEMFVPSPTVPMINTSDSEGVQTTKHHTTTSNLPDSPVWIENPTMKKPSRDQYFCCECYQLAESSSSGYQCCDPSTRRHYATEQSPFQCTSPYKAFNLSDFSSSGQNESSDQVQSPYYQCYCQGHAEMLNAEMLTVMTTTSDSSSIYSKHVPWYLRLWSMLKSQYQTDRLETPCPCTRSTIRSDYSKNRWRKQHSETSVHRRVQNISRKMSTRFKAATEGLRFGRHSKKDNVQNSHDSSDSKKSTEKQTSFKRRISAYRKRSLRPSWAQMRTMSNLDSQNRRHARKALRTISFILGAFMICWTPYHIIMMIKGFCDDFETHTSCVSHHLYSLTYWLCYMNSPINPFCYALSNASFRRTFFRILRGNFERK